MPAKISDEDIIFNGLIIAGALGFIEVPEAGIGGIPEGNVGIPEPNIGRPIPGGGGGGGGGGIPIGNAEGIGANGLYVGSNAGASLPITQSGRAHWSTILI